MITQIPTQRPTTPLLDQISSPTDLKGLSLIQLQQLADELRLYLLFCVGQTGGHLGGGLGVVELTIALHYLMNTPDDHLVWDVGHQAYPHKILTGRREGMLNIRQREGLTPFPDRAESIYDSFGTGHSSTSISAVLGMAIADKLKGISRKAVAVIGDGALTAGQAFEALNHAAHTHADLLVILNDNDMSISPNQGGLATYLAKNLRERAPTNPVMPLFEALNFEYSGPIDGNDLTLLLPALEQSLSRTGPQFLHVRTRKGFGFKPAEEDPVGYHAITKMEKPSKISTPNLKYSDQFGQWICQTATNDHRVVAVTPAMREGSGLVPFAKQYPDRYFDVAIAEQHAATFTAGLSVGGMKPVLAIYSTFLQRALDQIIHDIALQNLDCLIAVDRAGLVGEDGPTHSGIFDIPMLRTLPDVVIMTPSTLDEQQQMLTLGHQYNGCAVVRYPRGEGVENDSPSAPFTLGQSRSIRVGEHAVVLNFGTLLPAAEQVAAQLNLGLIDMRFVKPLDETVLDRLVNTYSTFITLEDGVIAGGAGSAVNEWLIKRGENTSCLNLGIPDRWIEHAARDEQLQDAGLDPHSIQKQIERFLRA
jgi:1-deoxy-D-xylulose-5-phosphate synthase